MRLYGKNPVLERIKASPGSIKVLYLQKRTDLSEIVRQSKKAGISFESVEKSWFDANCSGVHTQGVMAEVPEFEYENADRILSDSLKSATVPVFLDGITDPQNLGSIIRNLACLGGFSIVLPEHRSAVVNETVLRVASGGENYINIARVVNLATSIKKFRDKGVKVFGAVLEESLNVIDVKMEMPMALVVGSEGKGIRPGIEKNLDVKVALPMPGADLSYNAAVAASIMCYEINRRRWEDG